MKKIPPSYRLPLGISIVLHVALLIVLTAELPSVNVYRSQATTPVNIVNAVAVNQTDVNAEIDKLKEQQQQKRVQEQKRIQKLKQEALDLKKQRMAEQKRLATLQEKQAKLKKARKLALQKQREAEKQKALAAKRAKEKHARELMAKQNRLQQQLLQQQMAQEQQELAKAHAAQMQGVLDQYKAQIIQAIQSRWIVPDDANKNLSCVLLIRLAPGGVVLSVDTLKSSGSTVLDRSARVAVFKASPLPVPKDAAVFEKFRKLRLTVRPLQVMSHG